MGWIDMISPYFGSFMAKLDQTKQIHSKIINQKTAKIILQENKTKFICFILSKCFGD